MGQIDNRMTNGVPIKLGIATGGFFPMSRDQGFTISLRRHHWKREG